MPIPPRPGPQLLTLTLTPSTPQAAPLHDDLPLPRDSHPGSPSPSGSATPNSCHVCLKTALCLTLSLPSALVYASSLCWHIAQAPGFVTSSFCILRVTTLGHL